MLSRLMTSSFDGKLANYSSFHISFSFTPILWVTSCLCHTLSHSSPLLSSLLRSILSIWLYKSYCLSLLFMSVLRLQFYELQAFFPMSLLFQCLASVNLVHSVLCRCTFALRYYQKIAVFKLPGGPYGKLACYWRDAQNNVHFFLIGKNKVIKQICVLTHHIGTHFFLLVFATVQYKVPAMCLLSPTFCVCQFLLEWF